MTRKFLLAALVILLTALCTVHLTTERTPPENVVSPAVHLGMVVPREALEKLKAAETAALAAPQTAEPTADVTAEPAEEESLPATDTSVLAAAVTTDALYIRRSGDWDAEALALVDYGTTVAVTGKSGGWYQVRYDGIEGYLSGEYLDLRTSGLTGYGQGYDLEAAPTRLQALIMFIRVLGEEEQALAWSGTTPFTDIQPGSQAERYVGYAYSKGYTNGYSATQFKPAGAVNAYQYTEFVLRAMGYSSASNTNLSDTLERAVSCGVLTAGESAMLQSDPFLRAELVYISYYALDAITASGVTLASELESKGVFTSGELENARSMVSSWRL